MTWMRASTLAGRLGVVCGLLLMGIALAGCKTASADSEFAAAGGAIPPAANQATNSAIGGSGSAGSHPIDVIRVQDSLLITLSDIPVPLLPFEDRVKEDGTITLTQNQKFNVLGKSRGELESEIYIVMCHGSLKR